MQFWEKKNELPWKVNIFLAFSFIFIQNMEIKGKNTEKSFFLNKYIYFFIEMASITFCVTWKIDFLQNVVKTNKEKNNTLLCIDHIFN